VLICEVADLGDDPVTPGRLELVEPSAGGRFGVGLWGQVPGELETGGEGLETLAALHKRCFPEVLSAIGDETVEVACPAVVTISNELGPPRYPTMAGRMAARRKRATVVALQDLGLEPRDLEPRVTLARQYVPTVKGACEFIAGDTPADVAARLVARLRAEKVLA